MAAPKYDGVEKFIYSDTYNFFLKYKDVPNDDYSWEHIMDDARILNFKYHNYPMCRRMIIAVLDQLELKITGKPMDGMTYDEWEKKLGEYSKLTPFNPKTYKDPY